MSEPMSTAAARPAPVGARAALALAACAALTFTAWADQIPDKAAQAAAAGQGASEASTATPSTSASASGLQAVLTLIDDEGSALPSARAGQPFELSVALRDASTGEPPTGLRFDAWVRPVVPGAPSCGDAGRAFRATRRLPTDAVDLAGPVLAASFEDGAISLVDPRLDLASANALAAWSFRMPAAHLVADPRGTRFLASFPQTDEVVAIDAIAGRLSPVPGRYASPGSLIPVADGSFWVAQDGRGTLERIARDGRVLASHTLVPPIRLRDTAANVFLASASDGRQLLVERDRGTVLIEAQGRAADAIASENAEATGMVVATEHALHVHWLDGGRQRIDIGETADRVVAARDGRTVFALDRTAGMIAAIDLGTGKVLAVESFGEAIGAAAATSRALFLHAANQARVGVLSIAALSDPSQPSWRTVSLGPASAPRPGPLDDGLVVLDPSPQVLALNAATGTASVIADYDVMGDAPPMSAVRIRGGLLRSATLLARRFDSALPGEYRARTMLRNAGAHELVMTAGLGGMTLCLPFQVLGDGHGATVLRPRVELLPPAGERASGQMQAELLVSRGDGEPWTEAEVPVTISSLSTGWRAEAIARRIDGSRYAFHLRLPAPGSYAVVPAIPDFVPQGAMTIEVRR